MFYAVSHENVFMPGQAKSPPPTTTTTTATTTPLSPPTTRKWTNNGEM